MEPLPLLPNPASSVVHNRSGSGSTTDRRSFAGRRGALPGTHPTHIPDIRHAADSPTP